MQWNIRYLDGQMSVHRQKKEQAQAPPPDPHRALDCRRELCMRRCMLLRGGAGAVQHYWGQDRALPTHKSRTSPACIAASRQAR